MDSRQDIYVAKALKLGWKEVPGLGIVVDVFASHSTPGMREAYLDSHPGLASEIDEKKARLARIIVELSTIPSPTIQINLNDVCAHEACWRQSR